MMMMHNFFGDNLFDNENWPDTSFDREFFAKMNPLYGKHAKDVMLTEDVYKRQAPRWAAACTGILSMNS